MSAEAVWVPVTDAVNRYATAILALIISDVADGVIPASAADFSELHLFCDANMYFEQVGQVYDGTRESIDEIAAVGDEVTRRIQAGALVADQLEECHAGIRLVVDMYGSWERYQQTLRSLRR